MPSDEAQTRRLSWTDRARQLGRAFKRRLQVYRAVAKHPRTPWWSKALLGLTVAYALMPFDLIPDWIPVLGYLDDVIILPVLVWLALRSVPPEVLAECEESCGTACSSSRASNGAPESTGSELPVPPGNGDELPGHDGGDERAATESPSDDTPGDTSCDRARTERSD